MKNKRKIRRLMSITSLSILMGFSIGNVHAEVSPYLDGVETPLTYRMYSLNGASVYEEITAWGNGSNFDNDGINGLYDYTGIQFATNLATYGAALNFSSSVGIVTGNNYSLTIYFGLNTARVISPTYSSYSNKLDTSRGWIFGNYGQPADILSVANNATLDLGEVYNQHVYGYRYLATYSVVFKANASGNFIWTAFSADQQYKVDETELILLGYKLTNLGASALTEAEIQSALSADFDALNSNIDSMNEEQEITNDKLDEIIDSDISDQDKELPDDSSYRDYGEAEGELKDKVSQADLSQLSIGMDSTSSSWVWDTLTSLIQSHSVVFGLFIGMLSIGIIKLALGR